MQTIGSVVKQERKFSLNFRDKILDLQKPIVMGILNITPDSFYDGGKYCTEKDILSQTEKMLNEGASIIDIGAVSTRPGAKEVSEKEEWQRLKPVLNSLIHHFPGTIFSIDTYRSQIAEMAIELGAQMVNDISGGTYDKNMALMIAKHKVPYVLMHIKGTPQNMQVNPEYGSVVEDILKFFELQLHQFKECGVIQNIVLDPGFGFGKTLEHNFQLLKNLNRFHETGLPVLAGLSRKSMINKVLNTKPSEALNGTSVLNVLALLNGVKILRVHDVKEAIQTIELVQFYQNIGTNNA